MLVNKTLDPIEIEASSFEAIHFEERKFEPIVRRTKQRIEDVSFSVFFWTPRLPEEYIGHIHEIRNYLSNLNIRIICSSDICSNGNGGPPPDLPTIISKLKQREQDFDLFFAFLFDQESHQTELLNLPEIITKKLFLFSANGSIDRIPLEFEDRFCRTEFCAFPNKFEDPDFTEDLKVFLRSVRAAKYLQKIMEKNGGHHRNGRTLSIYETYSREIEIFHDKDYLFLLSFISDLKISTETGLKQHLHKKPHDIQTGLYNLKERGYLRKDIGDPEKIIVTDNGYYLFKLFDIFELDSTPLLRDDKKLFEARWANAILTTCRMTSGLFDHENHLKRATNDLYFAMAPTSERFRKIKHKIEKWIPLTEKILWSKELRRAQHEFVNNPLVKQLFEIWRENVSGIKQLWRTDIREQTEFIEFIYERMEKARNPKYKDIFINYSETAFGLGMLRPNSQVHIYLNYSFQQRPIKEIISDYLDMAIIGGRYDLLLKRYPPYHSLLKLHTKHGERTPFDSRRGIDFRPLTYRLDTKFTTPIEMKEIQTRQKDRYISCPIKVDADSESEKTAEIKKLETNLKGDAPHGGYFGNVELKSDGQFYEKGGGGKKGKVIEMYGMKRARYIQTEDQLKLLKAIPKPSSKSGLIIRFNLLDPVFILMEGINRKRDLAFDDLKLVLKILDLAKKEAGKIVNKALDDYKEEKTKYSRKQTKEEPDFQKIYDEKLKEEVGKSIDTVFKNPEIDNLSPHTLEFLYDLERFKDESFSLESSWKYLATKLVEGKSNDLLIAICQRLMDEGFDLTFSLLPLVMTSDIEKRKIEEIRVEVLTEGTDQTGIIQGESLDVARAESDKGFEKKTLLPLIELLKREMEDLLKKLFSEHIDISAATKKGRFEPKIAQMVIHHCLNVKEDRRKFTTDLGNLLQDHYRVHQKFLKEFYGISEGMTPIFEKFNKIDSDTVLKDIHGLNDGVSTRIGKDIDGIISLIDKTRLRLYSPSENNRLLCFIDPDSVEIQIGDFEYSGNPIDIEEEFLEARERYQIGLAEETRKQYFEAQKKKAVEEASVQHKRAETAAAGMKKKIEMMAMEVMRDHQVKQAWMKEEISAAEIKQAVQDVKLRAYEALKNGELKEYAISSLVEAHSDGGIEQVTEILRKSPKAYLAAMDSGLFELQETAGFKERLLEIAGEDRSKIDPITMAMLFNNDFKDVVGSYIHKEINNILSEFFKNMRRIRG